MTKKKLGAGFGFQSKLFRIKVSEQVRKQNIKWKYEGEREIK